MSANQILLFIAYILGRPVEKIYPTLDLIHDLRLNNMEKMDLIFRLENFLNIELSDLEIADIRTIQDLCAACHQALAHQPLVEA